MKSFDINWKCGINEINNLNSMYFDTPLYSSTKYSVGDQCKLGPTYLYVEHIRCKGKLLFLKTAGGRQVIVNLTEPHTLCKIRSGPSFLSRILGLQHVYIGSVWKSNNPFSMDKIVDVVDGQYVQYHYTGQSAKFSDTLSGFAIGYRLHSNP